MEWEESEYREVVVEGVKVQGPRSQDFVSNNCIKTNPKVCNKLLWC